MLIMPQPYPSNASLNSNCSIFISLPDGFLWLSKPALPSHTVNRNFLKMNAPQNQSSTHDWWTWHVNTPTPCCLGWDNLCYEAYVLLCFKSHHVMLDNTFFHGFLPFLVSFPLSPTGVSMDPLPNMWTQMCFWSSFWGGMHMKIHK